MLTMSRKISNDRARAILAGGEEPDFSNLPTDADLDLVLEKAIHWYRQNFNQPQAKKWVAEYLRSQDRDEDAKIVSRADKNRLKLISPYCRCHSRGFPMLDAQKAFTDKGVCELLDEAKTRVPVEPKERVSVQDRIEAKANEILAVLEPVLDSTTESVMGSKKKGNPLLEWIQTADLNKPMAVVVLDRLTNTFTELTAAYNKTDPDLVEGYSYLNPKSLKNLVGAFEEAIQNLNDRIGVLRASRKPRKVKPKSAQTQTKGLKFLTRSDAFGVDSTKASAIIGAQGFIMFNTKNNKATVFIAVEPKSGLGVKGSTIVGFDSAKSYEKTVRKPEEFVKNTDGCRKTFTAAVRYLNGIKTKAGTPTGRVNKHCLILQVN
jgi:hypothetical protein